MTRDRRQENNRISRPGEWILARWLRFYGKKRGHRRTGSEQIAHAGEAILFCSLLFVGATGMGTLLIWWIIPQWQADHHYIQHQATILGKRLEPNAEGDKFRPLIHIQYTFNGQPFDAWAYEATPSYSADQKAQEEILQGFDVGTQVPCWVAPDAPEKVVLVRGGNWPAWLLLLIPLPFVTIGGGGLIYTLLHWQTSTERRAAIVKRASELDPFEESAPTPKDFPAVPKASNLTNSPGTQLAFRLPITSKSGWKMFGSVTFCVAWNSIVSLFVVHAVRCHMAETPDWWLDVLLVPFALFGLWALFGLLRQVLATTGVGPTWVEVSDHPLIPGGNYRLLVCQSGRLNVRSLDVKLACIERASYHQGTNVRTEHRTVREEPIARCESLDINPAQPFLHHCQLTIPADAMHSFHSEFNEITWAIVIEGDAKGWPRFTRSFPVIVYPSTNRGSVV